MIGISLSLTLFLYPSPIFLFLRKQSHSIHFRLSMLLAKVDAFFFTLSSLLLHTRSRFMYCSLVLLLLGVCGQLIGGNETECDTRVDEKQQGQRPKEQGKGRNE